MNLNLNDIAPSIFIGLLVAALVMLIYAQFKTKDNDTFDLRDIICSWDSKSKKQIVSTDKSLLTGAFFASSYVLIMHYTNEAMFAYLTAWVANGGIAAWHKRSAAPKEKSSGGVIS
jgi:hypothetical protein